ncbi:hypothetical protein [Runella zeae]|uniref:hypothetical protein n=1 Tax=Runella zeae TaxID=94255 RepID=UPI002357FA0E|nr:hypothetical protein [Runella zeae]
MTTKDEILHRFGKALAEECFDPCLLYVEALRTMKKPFRSFEPDASYIQNLEENDYNNLMKFIPQILVIQLSNLLGMIESSEEFAIFHLEGNVKTNLLEISEMLSGEASTEYGWIAKFSKVLKDDQRIPPLL